MNQKVIKLSSHVVVHLCGIALVAAFALLAIVPGSHVEFLSDTFQHNDVVFGLSKPAFAIHIGLAACIWAMGFILFSWGKLNWSERKTLSIKRAHGTVLTETLIILPLFFLLVFGEAQLAINNIGGILANVAVYEAGRSAWVWKPEEDVGNKRMGVTGEIAQAKAEIAVALVMMPIAPGEFVSDQDIGDFPGKMRCAALMSHIPVSSLCDAAGSLAEITTTINQVTGANRATNSNLSVARAIDSTSFIQRTYTKFTHASHAANVTIDADGIVEMNYDHLIAMPLVGRVFGTLKTVGGREGYYTTYQRTYGLRAQINTPNAFLPNNDISQSPEPPEPQEGDLQGDLEAADSE